MAPLPSQWRLFVLRTGMTRDIIYALVLGYLLGSIPFGLLLTRLAGKGDLRALGSGNIGATNVLRTGSKWLAALTLVLDVLKGTAAVAIAYRLFAYELEGVPPEVRAAAAGAVIGHMYPVWLKFRGGKGVATFLGVLLPIFPAAALVYGAVWLALLVTIRISSVAGMAAAVSAPIVAFARHSSLFPMLLGFALLVLWKHRENILRLRKGIEPRIGRTRGQIG